MCSEREPTNACHLSGVTLSGNSPHSFAIFESLLCLTSQAYDSSDPHALSWSRLFSEMRGPEIVAEQEMRQRLDEDLGRRGHEVQVCLFRGDDLSTEHVLAMQRSSRDGSSSPPQQVVDIVQAAQIQLVLQETLDLGPRQRALLALQKINESMHQANTHTYTSILAGVIIAWLAD